MRSVRLPAVLGLVVLLAGLAGLAGPAALAGCAGGATETRPTVTPTKEAAPPGQTPSPEEGADVEKIEVTVQDGKPQPAPGRVEVPVGSTVRLTVTSDVADEVHVHTYDKDIRLQPNQPGSVEFTADIPGLFEVELHEAGTILFSLQVS